MTTTIRDQLMAALRNNPGLNSALLVSMVGMTSKKISGAISSLLADGLIACEGRYGQRHNRLNALRHALRGGHSSRQEDWHDATGAAHRDKRDLPGVPQQRGDEASIDGLGTVGV